MHAQPLVGYRRPVGTRIKVMHDCECWPLWVSDSAEVSTNESPADLGLSSALVGRLNACGTWRTGLRLRCPMRTLVTGKTSLRRNEASGHAALSALEDARCCQQIWGLEQQRLSGRVHRPVVASRCHSVVARRGEPGPCAAAASFG